MDTDNLTFGCHRDYNRTLFCQVKFACGRVGLFSCLCHTSRTNLCTSTNIISSRNITACSTSCSKKVLNVFIVHEMCTRVKVREIFKSLCRMSYWGGELYVDHNQSLN